MYLAWDSELRQVLASLSPRSVRPCPRRPWGRCPQDHGRESRSRSDVVGQGSSPTERRRLFFSSWDESSAAGRVTLCPDKAWLKTLPYRFFFDPLGVNSFSATCQVCNIFI